MFSQKKLLNAFVETENCQHSSITYLLQAVYLYLFRHVKTAQVCCSDSRHPGIKHEMDLGINMRKPRGKKKQSVVVRKGLNASYEKLKWHILKKYLKQSELKLTRTTLKKKL